MRKTKRTCMAVGLAILMLSAMFLSGCSCSSTPEPTFPAPTAPPQTEAPTVKPTEKPTEAPTETNPPAPVIAFSVGFGRREIMPDEDNPVILSNYAGTNRRMTGYNNKLYVNCIAMTDAVGTTLLSICWDTVGASEDTIQKIQKEIRSTYGIESSFVRISHTHNHAAVNMTSSDPANLAYVSTVVKETLAAVDEALADRKSAAIEVGTTYVEGMTYVRHYVRENGGISGDNYNSFLLSGQKYVRHTDNNPDRSMQLIRFVREGAKDIVMVGWRAHNTLGAGAEETMLQGGFPVEMVKNLEASTDCYAVFYQCDAGRLNPTSKLTGEITSIDMATYGKLLADYALNGLETCMEKVDSGLIRTIDYTYRGQINHEKSNLRSIAMQLQSTFDKGSYTSAETMQLCAEMNEQLGLSYYDGIHSKYHVSAIINRPTKDTGRMHIHFYSIGDSVALTFDSFEMFDQTGKYIRENSPYKMTMVIGYSDATIGDETGYGYIPTIDAWEYGCYEADKTRWARGTAEELQKIFVEQLKILKGELNKK
ncbi:MAG: hypothetical protein IKY02_02030 [Lachnospiraceae bacterium]|nr:hypothetical protein [Lachnospiraceae bacterium]